MIEITEDELRPMRELALTLMNKTADIERYTEEDDGALGTIETWTVINRNLPCRVAETEGSSERENVQAGRVTSVGDYLVRFPYGTDIHENDRIKVRVSRDVRTLQVSRVLEHSYATTTSVLCSEAR